MPCKHCPHCRDADLSATLILTTRPTVGAVVDGNRAFYRMFARTYDLARAAGNARQLIMAANPWMSLSQYREYLKRARALGFVSTPGRTVTLQQPAAAPAPTRSVQPLPTEMDEDMRRWLASARGGS